MLLSLSLSNKVLKKSIYQQIFRKCKFGQKIIISLLLKSTNHRFRVVTYKGYILQINKNKKGLALHLKQTIFGYSFSIKFSLRSLNLVRLLFF